MGVSGTLEYISELMNNGHKHKKKKKQLQTVDLKVRMDCDGCERKVKNTLMSLSGKYIYDTLNIINFTTGKLTVNYNGN